MTAARSRTALITGGTRGIGLGIARALAQDGWDLALCGVRPRAEVSAVVTELQHSGVAVHYIAADLARQQDRRGLVECLMRGRLATPQVVVVHRRQVVVHQGIAMHTFQRRARHQRLPPRHLEQGRAFHYQKWPEPLSATEA